MHRFVFLLHNFRNMPLMHFCLVWRNADFDGVKIWEFYSFDGEDSDKLKNNEVILFKLKCPFKAFRPAYAYPQ